MTIVCVVELLPSHCLHRQIHLIEFDEDQNEINNLVRLTRDPCTLLLTEHAHCSATSLIPMKFGV